MNRQNTNVVEINKHKNIYGNSRMKKFIILIKILLFCTLIFAVVILVLLSPVYNINSVNVYGTKKYSKERIISASGIETGSNGFKEIGSSIENIFTLRYGKAEQAIKNSLPWIRDVSVKYLVPDRVRIKVSDRIPFASITFPGGFLLLDEDGYAIEFMNESKDGYPVVKGVRLGRYKLGQAVQPLNEGSLENAYKVIDIIKESDENGPYDIYEFVKEIDIENSKEIKLFINDSFVVNLGNMVDINYKITFMKNIYFNHLSKDKGLLDFTAGNNPTFIPE